MKTTLYVIWALFCLLAVASCVVTLRRTRARDRMTAPWPRVAAVVTGHRAGWNSGIGRDQRRRRYFAYYQFTDPTGFVFAGESEIGRAARPEPGSRIEVAYNPANPHESIQPAPQAKVLLGCIIPFVAVFLIVAFFFIQVLTR